MPPRTDSQKVKGVLGVNYGSIDLAPFMDTANVVVTRVAACAIGRSITLTAAELELIERWLSGHFYAMADQLYTSKSTGGASGTFQGQTGMYLESTIYGQTAMRLDWSGCLQAIGGPERKVAGGFWLGKPPSKQTDYSDRD